MCSIDHAIYSIEKKYGVQGIESGCRGLAYLQDDEKKMLGIMAFVNGQSTCAILKKSQVKALIDELQDIYDMIFD